MSGKSARIRFPRPRNRRKNRIMPTNWRTLELDHYAVLRISGPDAVSFLQGQLSNDMTLLGAKRSLLAGLHTAQGRVIAILRLLRGEGEEILALLPRELLTGVSDRLRRYVLRAKVQLTDATPQWRVRGLIGPSDGVPRELELPQGPGAQLRADGEYRVCISQAPGRWVILAPA